MRKERKESLMFYILKRNILLLIRKLHLQPEHQHSFCKWTKILLYISRNDSYVSELKEKNNAENMNKEFASNSSI